MRASPTPSSRWQSTRSGLTRLLALAPLALEAMQTPWYHFWVLRARRSFEFDDADDSDSDNSDDD
tara:strand:- start:31844 stop:32038 length:195 start_codon:yes stop_codon:yes gene_type:complete